MPCLPGSPSTPPTASTSSASPSAARSAKRVFFFAGFDQHLFFVPTLVRFDNGDSTVVPIKGQEPLHHGDYEDSDKELVLATATHLSTLSGNYQSQLLGNTGFLKTDFALNSRNYLSLRLNTSRYWGSNNVFFDPASPITNFALSENGEESVRTATAALALNSALSPRLTNHLRAQVSRDLQSSTSNSSDPRTRISSIIEGFGRSTILPRHTNEDRLHLAETMSLEAGRSTFKFGGDTLLTRITNFFPAVSGGEYIFSTIKVNPFTFVPEEGGLELTPLRAYAHGVPRYYIQNFGNATTHPNTREYAAFAQNTLRLRDNFNLSLGVRYDLQTFSESGMTRNPLWPQAGRLPRATNDVAPRAGFSWSLGNDKPLVVRGGFGIFYARIPQIYTSALATNNGVNSFNLILDNTKLQDRELFPQGTPLFPTYPPPSHLARRMRVLAHRQQISSATSPAMSPPSRRTTTHRKFSNPASASRRNSRAAPPAPSPSSTSTASTSSAPATSTFPRQPKSYTPSTTTPASTSWATARSTRSPPGNSRKVSPARGHRASTHWPGQFPSSTLLTNLKQKPPANTTASRSPCSAASTTASTSASATPGPTPSTTDPTRSSPASLATCKTPTRPPPKKQPASPTSVTAKSSLVAEPTPVPASQPILSEIFNHWKLASVVTIGSGRPYDAKVTGDPNQDGNSLNDRLPGLGRKSLVGPAYRTIDSRFSRNFRVTNNTHLSLIIEAFNLFNHLNKRILTDAGGFVVDTTQFVPFSQRSGTTYYPAQYRRSAASNAATSAYAPRQVQVAVRLTF